MTTLTATIAVDCTALVADANAYLTTNFNLNDTEHRTNAFHWLGNTSVVTTAIPSLANTFSAANLTVAGAALISVNKNFMYNTTVPATFSSQYMIPISQCETTTLTVFEINANVSPSSSTDETGTFYNVTDCTVANTIALTSPVFIDNNTVYALTTSDQSNLSNILAVYFNEDTTGYFV